jgi:hypothetical protein
MKKFFVSVLEFLGIWVGISSVFLWISISSFLVLRGVYGWVSDKELVRNVPTYTYVVTESGEKEFLSESLGYWEPYEGNAKWVWIATPQGPQKILVEAKLFVSPYRL